MWIAEKNPLFRFLAPKFDLFDGTTIPIEHVTHYHKNHVSTRTPKTSNGRINVQSLRNQSKRIGLGMIQEPEG